MQLSIKKICLSLAMATLLVSAVTSAQAATTYTEDEFLNKFSGKTQKVIAVLECALPMGIIW